MLLIFPLMSQPFENTYQPLLWEAQHNYKSNVKKLISSGMKVDIVDGNGDQPLHWAARHGDAELARMLLEAGAKVDAADKNGDQPIHWASRYGNYGNTEIFKVLLAAGAKTDQPNRSGETANSISKHIGSRKGDAVNMKGSLDEAAINYIENNLNYIFIRAKMCGVPNGHDDCDGKSVILCYQNDSLGCELYGFRDYNVIKEVTQSFQNSGLRISRIRFWQSTFDKKSFFEKPVYQFDGGD